MKPDNELSSTKDQAKDYAEVPESPTLFQRFKRTVGLLNQLTLFGLIAYCITLAAIFGIAVVIFA